MSGWDQTGSLVHIVFSEHLRTSDPVHIITMGQTIHILCEGYSNNGVYSTSCDNLVYVTLVTTTIARLLYEVIILDTTYPNYHYLVYVTLVTTTIARLLNEVIILDTTYPNYHYLVYVTLVTTTIARLLNEVIIFDTTYSTVKLPIH